MTREDVAQATLNAIAYAAKVDPHAAAWGAYAFLQDRAYGMPSVSLMQEDARSQSLFWADTASPIELECYMLAAATKLAENGSLFHGKHIKRLIAALYKKMSPDERAAFGAWIKTQEQ